MVLKNSIHAVKNIEANFIFLARLSVYLDNIGCGSENTYSNKFDLYLHTPFTIFVHD